MSTHLTVISYCQVMQPLFEGIILRVRPGGSHEVIRCQRGADLYEKILNFGRDEITLLDLVGHGGEDHFHFGDDKEFVKSGQEPPVELKNLDGILPKDARIRLLGCKTGAGKQGLAMIQAVSRALNGREVFGVTTYLSAVDFDETGMPEDHPGLISSKAQSPVEVP
ncbi:MAG: DUF4347 domain-containing protein [Myxococcaceae bacterium]|nr:DUF4347 domain-containing protein [Myxococcaceae bacterium]